MEHDEYYQIARNIDSFFGSKPQEGFLKKRRIILLEYHQI